MGASASRASIELAADKGLSECINRGRKPRMREETDLLHSLPAGVPFEIWVLFSKSPTVKPESVLKKVIEIGQFWRPCQAGIKEENEIFILKKRCVGVIGVFKPLKGCLEGPGEVWFLGTSGSQGWSGGGIFSPICDGAL